MVLIFSTKATMFFRFGGVSRSIHRRRIRVTSPSKVSVEKPLLSSFATLIFCVGA